ncbi:unnamed protein product [Paramecium sonneborni]|uniref:Uncharacterized protein n=1 Tax=Paramecium sonneborni TaxID=65129 RepID=A0A8S1R1R9_9CILI|nr:unnamed protein product [Paramecium sonneborni]
MNNGSNKKNAIYKPTLPRLKIIHQQRQILSSPQKTKFIDEKKLEQIVERRNFQKQLIDLVIPIHDDAQSSIINSEFSKGDLLKHYKQLPSKPTLLFEKAMKGLHPLQQQEYRNKELEKLDKKVQQLNERNPLQESWKSPFLSQPRLYKSSEEVDLSASQDIDPNVQNVVVLNENLRGFGSRLRSYLDYDKHTVFERQKGNPKYLYRDNMIRMIKNNSTKELDLVKEWNFLINYDKLTSHAQLQKPEIRMQQFGTISSISHYYSIQDFHKKKMGQSLTQQTPNSQISPQFVVKNSRQSNSSEPIDFGKSNQVLLDVSEVEKGQDDVSIHKDTFLTYCQVFWDLIRKEDEIVERVVWAFCKGDYFTFSGFKHFYKLIVFQEGTFEDYIKFTYDFFLASDRSEIPFTEIQGLLRLLASKIDGKDHVLSDQILMDIVNQIHRPQVISKETLQQLIFEDKIPPTVVVKMVYEQS